MGRDDDLDRLLDRLEELYEEEDLERAWNALERARKIAPDDLTVREWEAVFAADDLRFEEALGILDGVLKADRDRPFAARERAGALMELWRFDEARKQLQRILERGLAEDDLDEAAIHFELAQCLERLDKAAEAERELKRAAELAPDEYPVPPRYSTAEFEALVARALDSIPAAFAPYLRQVSVVVRDVPPRDAPGPFILGLYSGLPRTERTHDERDHLDTVFVFQRNHETLNLPREELEEEVRKTVVHEVAHHFGLGEDDMGAYA